MMPFSSRAYSLLTPILWTFCVLMVLAGTVSRAEDDEAPQPKLSPATEQLKKISESEYIEPRKIDELIAEKADVNVVNKYGG